MKERMTFTTKEQYKHKLVGRKAHSCMVEIECYHLARGEYMKGRVGGVNNENAAILQTLNVVNVTATI